MARLVRVAPDEDPGFRRVRSGSGFRYVDPAGETAPEADRERISDLVIPPAWHDVWIAADPLAHIQAVESTVRDASSICTTRCGA